MGERSKCNRQKSCPKHLHYYDAIKSYIRIILRFYPEYLASQRESSNNVLLYTGILLVGILVLYAHQNTGSNPVSPQ